MIELMIMGLIAWAVGLNFFMIILFRKTRDMNEKISQLYRGRIMYDLLKPREQK